MSHPGDTLNGAATRSVQWNDHGAGVGGETARMVPENGSQRPPVEATWDALFAIQERLDGIADEMFKLVRRVTALELAFPERPS